MRRKKAHEGRIKMSSQCITEWISLQYLWDFSLDLLQFLSKVLLEEYENMKDVKKSKPDDGS